MTASADSFLFDQGLTHPSTTAKYETPLVLLNPSF